MTVSAPSPWQSGVRGARANLLPGLVLQAAALGLVLGYYHSSRVHAALAALTEFREHSGIGFAIFTTGLFGGYLPFLYLHYGQKDASGRPRYDLAQGFWLVAFWGYKGVEVDIWYRLQTVMFGAGHDFRTIFCKCCTDQLGYSPIISVPITAAVYQLIDREGLIADFKRGGWFRRRVLPLLIANAGVWVPAVAIIYALPTPLQLPLQNIVLCFYTLIVAHQTLPHADDTVRGR
ncbi:MAG TPA: hypothetical protein VGL42_14665 [Opitutaceae bacterium]